MDDDQILESKKKVAAFIKTNREAMGWTQGRLARKLCIHQQRIYEYENCVKEPRASILFIMAEVFGKKLTIV